MRILLAIDGSQPAERARDLVAALPWPRGTSVRVVTVAERREAILFAWAPSAAFLSESDRIENEVVRSHTVALESAESAIKLARPDITVETVLLRGRAATVIVDEAGTYEADLVVVGHRGFGAIETMLLGSVSAEVVDHAPCPVLVARAATVGPILLAHDGSPSAMSAEAILTTLPLAASAPVTVMSVTENALPFTAATAPGVYDWGMAGYIEGLEAARRDTQAMADEVVARLRRAGVDAAAVVYDGDPAQELVEYAKEHRTGLIVLGTRGHTGLRRLVLGSVARNVLTHAPCSVLVVRGPAAMEGSEAQEEPVVTASAGPGAALH
jgi:nucleotide-binding universal stress UspA family protein